MIEKINKKIGEEQKTKLEKKIEIEEMKKIVKKMHKKKAPGIDGIPVEFYQTFDFVVEWLYDLYGEMIERGSMTETMRTSVVKLLFKKKDKKKDPEQYKS